MDHAIGILGQTILLLTALAIVIALVFLIVVEIGAVIRVVRDYRPRRVPVRSSLPYPFGSGRSSNLRASGTPVPLSKRGGEPHTRRSDRLVLGELAHIGAEKPYKSRPGEGSGSTAFLRS
jgi:hypothetical protein